MAATAQILAEIAARAGAVVMRHYQAGPLSGKDVARIKTDRSPVTDADEEAERLILEELARAFPGVPVVVCNFRALAVVGLARNYPSARRWRAASSKG